MTIFKQLKIQWHKLQSYCCVTMAIIYSWNLFICLDRNTVMQWVPITASFQPSLGSSSLLSASVNLHVLDVSQKWNHTVFSFCDWLISFSMFSRFSHVIACVRISFLLMLNNTLWYIYTVSAPYLWVPHLQTQPTTDEGKKKQKQKVP